MHPDILRLFTERGWKPFDFQVAVWEAYARGQSGLINAPTGVGKTMAAWLGPVGEGIREEGRGKREGEEWDRGSVGSRGGSVKERAGRGRRREIDLAEPVRVLWITPLRALAKDTADALLDPVKRLALPWTVQMRTGDTPQSMKKKQRERLPTALVTTPESLTLLLSYPEARERFSTLRAVVVDEWHELIGTKRGVQTELALARLRRWLPAMRTWGVSATLGNLEEARDVLLGSEQEPAWAALIRGQVAKDLRIATVIPADIERFPWAGHLGTRSVGAVIEAVRGANSTLLFTNTRSQAEIWFKRLITEADDLIGQVAIHHGSLDRDLRTRVENMLSAGKLRCVVCTSSLDLGVDFAPVDQVIQVGSPKGVARLLQRAGRSGHQPGAKSRVLGVPTHAFELLEFAAAREAAASGKVESRTPVDRPLDVLVQHLVTIACGEGAAGFDSAELLAEVRSTHAFRALKEEDWAWAMDFVSRGGPALKAYPHFARIVEKEGRWVVASEKGARMHRMMIGTITGETSMKVKYLSGTTLGTIEEGFISRLEIGSKFVFAGRVLELLRVKEMTAYVQRARTKSGVVPTWDGGRFSLSTQLADAVRVQLEHARRGEFNSPELRAVRPLLDLQAEWSRVPATDELLIEIVRTERVHNAVIYLFAGRMAHEGLGVILAYRVARLGPATITSVSTDYGICLTSSAPIEIDEAGWRAVLSGEGLLDDLFASLNSSRMAQRQFRDIARIAGLVVPGFPGAVRPMRHLQASSEMFYDVFEEFDPGNLLIAQAKREVLEAQLEVRRLKDTLARAAGQRLVIVRPETVTPMAFPIWAERLRANTLSTEKWADMVAKMVVALEARADRGDREDGEKRAGRPVRALKGAPLKTKERRARGRTGVGG